MATSKSATNTGLPEDFESPLKRVPMEAQRLLEDRPSFTKTIFQPDFRGVFPSLVRAAIARQLLKMGASQLPNECLHDRIRYVNGVFEKGAEKPSGRYKSTTKYP